MHSFLGYKPAGTGDIRHTDVPAKEVSHRISTAAEASSAEGCAAAGCGSAPIATVHPVIHAANSLIAERHRRITNALLALAQEITWGAREGLEVSHSHVLSHFLGNAADLGQAVNRIRVEARNVFTVALPSDTPRT